MASTSNIEKTCEKIIFGNNYELCSLRMKTYSGVLGSSGEWLLKA